MKTVLRPDIHVTYSTGDFHEFLLIILIGVLHNLNCLIRLFSLFSLVVLSCPRLCTQAVHTNDNACLLRCTLHDHYKAHKSGSIELCQLCEHFGYCDT